MVVSIFTFLILFILQPLLSLQQVPMLQATHRADRPQVEVAISVLRTRFVVGERIPIIVQITNRDKVEFAISSRLTTLIGGDSALIFDVSDSEGELSDKRVGDIYLVRASPREVPEDLWRSWILLAPGYSYGATINLDRSSFAHFSKPGKYEISCTYYSRGTGGLPSLRGDVRSNSISIEIISASR